MTAVLIEYDVEIRFAASWRAPGTPYLRVNYGSVAAGLSGALKVYHPPALANKTTYEHVPQSVEPVLAK